MDHYPLHEGELDDAMIRRWAFDLDAYLTEQDEDIFLHDWLFAETLLDLAADPSCPKATYILNIWDYFTRRRTVYQDSSDLEAVRHALVLAEKYSGHNGVKKWIAAQNQRLKYVDGVGTTDRATALSIGDTMLNGLSRSCTIEILRESDTAFLVQLSVPEGAHKEWLFVDKRTGKFRYCRYWSDVEREPR